MKNAFEIEYKKHEIPNFALRKSILQIPKIDLHSTGSGFFSCLIHFNQFVSYRGS